MPHQPSAKDLLDRWQSGDQAAAQEIHRRYAQRLCALAEQRIGGRLRRRVAADDVVQSTFRTFFRRCAEGEFAIDHTGSLWQLLVRITLNKVCNQAARHRAGKRDLAAETYAADEHLEPAAVAHDPDPEEAAALADELENLFAGLKPPEQEILRLAFQGYTTPQVAQQVGRSRWTVRRVLDRIGWRLQERLGPD